MATTIYWHDYEAFGANPRRDRASQFAGLRTDTNLNIIGDPLVLYCQPAPDMLPHPDACLLTGITPQHAREQGLPEAQFIGRILDELGQPGTCTAGYNSIRFDDELTRQLLYRNFHDPYEREWRNGNSRWDIIDMLRLCHALRPEGIRWPRREDGGVSFRLEELTAANGIGHEEAHDALSDVKATIAMAARVREAQPKLFDYVFELRRKKAVQARIDLEQQVPFLHVSALYGGANGAIAPVMPLAPHPVDSNAVIVCDLRHDPAAWIDLDAATLRRRLFTPAAERDEGEPRLPLSVVRTNRCPVIAPMNTLDEDRARALHIDLRVCERHHEVLRARSGLAALLAAVYDPREAESMPPATDDPDFMLYSGGFFSDVDRRLMQRVRSLPPESLGETAFDFQDPRLPEMLFRYRARNHPATLSVEEQQRWQVFCAARLTRADDQPGAGPTLAAFDELLRNPAKQARSEREGQAIRQALRDWRDEVAGFAGIAGNE